MGKRHSSPESGGSVAESPFRACLKTPLAAVAADVRRLKLPGLLRTPRQVIREPLGFVDLDFGFGSDIELRIFLAWGVSVCAV